MGEAGKSLPPSPLGSGVDSSALFMDGMGAITGLTLTLVSLSRTLTSPALSVNVMSPVAFDGLVVGENPPLLGEAGLGGIGR